MFTPVNNLGMGTSGVYMKIDGTSHGESGLFRPVQIFLFKLSL